MSISYMSGYVSGVIVGIILFFILWKFWKREKSNSQYDERQKLIKGQVAMHTLIFAGVLLVISTVLSETVAVWLSLSSQNILILALTMIYFLSEQVLRGSYFSVNFQKRNLGILTLAWLIYIILTIKETISVFQGKSDLFTGQSSLAINFSFVVYWWVVVLYTIILVAWWLGARKKGNS